MIVIGESLMAQARRVEVHDQLVVPWALDGGFLRRDNE